MSFAEWWGFGTDTRLEDQALAKEREAPMLAHPHMLNPAEQARLTDFQAAKDRWLKLKGDAQRLDIRTFNERHPELKGSDFFVGPGNIDTQLYLIKRGLDPTAPPGGETKTPRQTAYTPSSNIDTIQPTVTTDVPIDTKWYEDRTTTNRPDTSAKKWYDFWDPASDLPGANPTPPPDLWGALSQISVRNPLVLFEGIVKATIKLFGYVVWDVNDLVRLMKGWDGTLKMLMVHPTFMMEVIWRVAVTLGIVVGTLEVGPLLLVLTEWIRMLVELLVGVFRIGEGFVQELVYLFGRMVGFVSRHTKR